MEKLLRASGHHPVNRTSPKQMTDDDSEYIRCSKCGKMITQVSSDTCTAPGHTAGIRRLTASRSRHLTTSLHPPLALMAHRQDVDEVEEHTRTCVTIEYKKAVYNAELQAAAFAARSRTGHAGL